VDYCERNPALSAIARHNHVLLGLEARINWHTGDGMEWLASRQQEGSQIEAPLQTASREEASHPETGKLDLIYIDPSRRSGGRRVHSLQDSEPDVTQHLALIRSTARRCLVKLSPMLDPVDAARSLEGCAAVTAVSVDGELKELLADCITAQNPSVTAPRQPVFRAVLLDATGNERFRFSSDSTENGTGGQVVSSDQSQNTEPENDATPGPELHSSRSVAQTSGHPGSLLFEPDPALFKMRLIDEAARRYGLGRIHPQIGYLIGPDAVPETFPGKIYRIRRTLPFKPRALRKWLADNRLTRVHIHQRGFPLTVDQLYSKLGCRMGEEAHLFATLSADGQKVLVVTDRTG
jgi:hypothetical protein